MQPATSERWRPACRGQRPTAARLRRKQGRAWWSWLPQQLLPPPSQSGREKMLCARPKSWARFAGRERRSEGGGSKRLQRGSAARKEKVPPTQKTSGAQAAPLLTHDMHSHGRASSQSTRKHECPFLFAACAFACICLCMHFLLVTSSCRLVGCISLPSPSHAPVLAAQLRSGCHKRPVTCRPGRPLTSEDNYKCCANAQQPTVFFYCSLDFDS
jgi:hypothetical protein